MRSWPDVSLRSSPPCADTFHACREPPAFDGKTIHWPSGDHLPSYLSDRDVVSCRSRPVGTSRTNN